MGTEQDTNLWAVVFTAAGRFICKLQGDDIGDRLAKPGVYLQCSEAYEIVTQSIPVPTPQGILIDRRTECIPVIANLEPAPIQLHAVGVQLVKDMVQQDQLSYLSLIDSAKNTAMHNRMKKAGLASGKG